VRRLELPTPYHKSPYVFPILVPGIEDLTAIYDRKINMLKRFNKNFKVIAKKIGLEKLTSYVARHSWATVMRDARQPHEVISNGLGHQDPNQTMTYLGQFDNKVLDKANEAIL
jgi:integrase